MNTLRLELNTKDTAVVLDAIQEALSVIITTRGIEYECESLSQCELGSLMEDEREAKTFLRGYRLHLSLTEEDAKLHYEKGDVVLWLRDHPSDSSSYGNILELFQDILSGNDPILDRYADERSWDEVELVVLPALYFDDIIDN